MTSALRNEQTGLTLAIVQARVDSTRLPGKVLKKIGDKTLIEVLLYRLSRAKKIDKIMLATAEGVSNDPLVELAKKLDIDVFRGSEEDVLDRYYKAAMLDAPKIVVRVTGDCPLIDPNIVDDAIGLLVSADVDYVNNMTPPTFPDGMDVEVFTFEALKRCWERTTRAHDREHVSGLMRSDQTFSRAYLRNNKQLDGYRLTVDEESDLVVVKGIFEHYSPNLNFDLNDIVELRHKNPEIFLANKTISRDEGSMQGAGQKLWKRAKHLIPGGNMLLSKRSEMFLPDHWPAYFSRAKGCRVWDLDGLEYIDMSIMGIGTNILGYGHPLVDQAVQEVVDKGNMSTFNCPEEVFLAEKLIEMHPWADMVRFARSGGEANAIAIRIARAASGKDQVAVCGYHGWHDWYLAANLNDDDALDGHLLPGLDPNGVPRHLKNSILTFDYNNFDQLSRLVEDHEIGVIKMEVQRSEPPKDQFLEKVRKLATDKNIVLIFDECTSGFRETFGGLHKKYKVNPDVAVFGKALGNGYAITSVIGRREIMEAAQSTFISSTFWTERIGPAAALKTLEVMEREKSWETITSIGLSIRKGWQKLADRYGLEIAHWGLPTLTGFTIQSDNALAYKTLITQEMLAKGYLAGNSVYVCTEHKPEIIDTYFDEVDSVFGLIRECEDGRHIDDLLRGPICHSGFKRLN